MADEKRNGDDYDKRRIDGLVSEVATLRTEMEHADDDIGVLRSDLTDTEFRLATLIAEVGGRCEARFDDIQRQRERDLEQRAEREALRAREAERHASEIEHAQRAEAKALDAASAAQEGQRAQRRTTLVVAVMGLCATCGAALITALLAAPK